LKKADRRGTERRLLKKADRRGMERRLLKKADRRGVERRLLKKADRRGVERRLRLPDFRWPCARVRMADPSSTIVPPVMAPR